MRVGDANKGALRIISKGNKVYSCYYWGFSFNSRAADNFD